MNLMEIRNEIARLGMKIREKSAELQALAGDEAAGAESIQAAMKELQGLQARQSAMRASYETEEKAQAGLLTQTNNQKEEKTMNEIRKSNEYAKAFAYAVMNGLNPKTGRNVEQLKPLYDAMTEGGGSPAGADGGFLVPEDIDNRINELKRDYGPMAPLFGAENVTAPTGWRVVDTAPTAALPAVNEMGTIADAEQPTFVKVPYTINKYAGIIPVSNELMEDNVAGLFEYLARWFARKAVMTENSLILAALAAGVTPTAVGTGKPLSMLKTILNKTLDPAISRNAVIIVNQNGLDLLDQLEDDNKRGLLQPDPTNATQLRAFGRPVHVFSNAVMASDIIYVGDGHEFGTMFTRQGLEVRSTDIGGNAWKTDSTEVRGIIRMGFSAFDAAAMAGLSF